MKKNIIDKFKLDKKVVILTGSAGRIGQRFAHILSDAGANVVLVDIEEKSNKNNLPKLKYKKKVKSIPKIKKNINNKKIYKSKYFNNYDEYLLEREKRFKLKPSLFTPSIITKYNNNYNDNLIIKIGL